QPNPLTRHTMSRRIRTNPRGGYAPRRSNPLQLDLFSSSRPNPLNSVRLIWSFRARPLFGRSSETHAYARTLAIGRRNCSASRRQPRHDLQVGRPQEAARAQIGAPLEIPCFGG